MVGRAGWVGCALLRTEGLGTKSVLLLCVGWVTLSVLTPFYHPYARLWLPVEAFGWLLFGGLFVEIRSIIVSLAIRGQMDLELRVQPSPLVCSHLHHRRDLERVFFGRPWTSRQLALLDPSDSLRIASQSILNELPKDVSQLRVLARPSLTFYLALGGGVIIGRQPDLARLVDSRDPRVVGRARHGIDPARELSAGRPGPICSRDWTIVREIPTTLNPPTLLDIDPAAARGGEADASAPLRLLRPRRMRGRAMNPAPPVSLWPDPEALGTLTDLYELTMMAGYYSAGMATRSATFELFVR